MGRVEQEGFEYQLVSFDKDGQERDEGGAFSKEVLHRLARESFTDVFVMSHGWKGDVPGAVEQYNRWFRALNESPSTDPRSKVLFVGVHWPSLWFGDETIGTSFDIAAPVDMKELISAFEDDPEEYELATKVLDEARRCAYEITPQAQDALLDLAGRLGLTDDPSGLPGSDGPALTVEAFQPVDEDDDLAFGGAVRSGATTILVQLSFWKMKKRARTVGESGIHLFLQQMLEANTQARLHLMGHSLGSIVVSAAVGGANAQASLKRPIHSLALVQGAVSLWAYAPKIELAGGRPGYFQSILKSESIAGPVITTQSQHDSAVRWGYAFSAKANGSIDFSPGVLLPKFGGIGTFGIQGLPSNGAGFKQSMGPLLSVAQSYDLKPGHVHNLNGSAYIPDHNAISGPEVAHALWSAARSGV